MEATVAEADSEMRDRVERIRDEQLSRALARLEARGELTAERRAELERLADRLTAELLAIPAAGLAADDVSDGREAARTVRELFAD